jgi:hypothetical protein
MWTSAEANGPEVGPTTHGSSVAAEAQVGLGATPSRGTRPQDLTGDSFITVDETGADVLISETRTVAEVIRQVRERALHGMAADPRFNPRTRHLRRMRHRHGHERLR